MARHVSLPAVFASLTIAALSDCNASAAEPSDADGLSSSASAIHQEVRFRAPCERIYAALTSTSKFDALTRLSDAAALVTAANAKPTHIDARVGGSFVLFGGYVTGLNVELLPGQRLVQAWRAGSWGAGEYSIARFALSADQVGCKLVFDQRGFPDSQGKSLADGWGVHYWTPLAKLLGES